MRRYPGNHTDSELLTVPRNLKTRPGAPQTHLAYITDSEANLLQEHKPGTPHKGAAGIPNYDSWDIDESGRGSFTSGAEASARENPQDRSQQRQDYSHSTRDVRSSAQDRQQFRKDTGSKVVTEAENLARTAHALTKNPNYLNMPIFNPKGLYEARLDPVTGEWSTDPGYDKLFAAANEAAKTGNNELFFSLMGDLEDISAGNPNLDFQQGFGTGYDDWYKSPPLQGGGGGGGGGGWGGGYGGGGGGYGGGGGGYGPPEKPQFPGQPGERWGAQMPLQQAMINIHGGQGFQQGFARGGIVSLVE